jgi:diguanylate cyclase
VELLMKDLPKKCFRLVLMDLNELKAINDTYGHRAGDEALILSFSAVDEVFSPYGSCYRISGDEFACLLEPLDELLFREKTEALRTLLHSRSSGVPFTLELALGSRICRKDGEADFQSFYHEADNMMYEDKKLQKYSRRNKPEGAVIQEEPV